MRFQLAKNILRRQTFFIRNGPMTEKKSLRGKRSQKLRGRKSIKLKNTSVWKKMLEGLSRVVHIFMYKYVYI